MANYKVIYSMVSKVRLDKNGLLRGKVNDRISQWETFVEN
jgi:hypothetical protein